MQNKKNYLKLAKKAIRIKRNKNLKNFNSHALSSQYRLVLREYHKLRDNIYINPNKLYHSKLILPLDHNISISNFAPELRTSYFIILFLFYIFIFFA